MINKQDFVIRFESDPNYTATYHETISFYAKLAKSSSQILLNDVGQTDSGFPLSEVIISKDGDFDPVSIKQKGKNILFINNAIHPGEPCGVDATMMLARDLVSVTIMNSLLENTVVVLIPIYNISGSLNRGSHSRANQNGPHEYGFRGNIQNYDLNRDFIKCDTKNAESFNKLFCKWSPDVFVDNHTSNGADYQYTMTLIATQKDKLQKQLGDHLSMAMLPRLYDSMKDKNWEMTPYVNARSTPDKGIAGFLDLPRYSSGYGAIHHVISFMPETHMLKPYEDRVWSTYAFMHSMLEELAHHGDQLQKAKQDAINAYLSSTEVDINWELDQDQKENLTFKGYEAKHKKSHVSGQDRLYYDHAHPYEKEVPFFNTYVSKRKIKKPLAYIIPQAYQKVIDRLRWNGVKMSRLESDAIIVGEAYYITDYVSTNSPYEGHYLHREVELRAKTMERKYYKGDYRVDLGQTADRYIIEALEPQAADSYFAWNFFDAILMQKEYFSSYVFEDLAVDILAQNPELKQQLEDKKKNDESFAENARAQLDFIYKNSKHYEWTHNLYPIMRILK